MRRQFLRSILRPDFRPSHKVCRRNFALGKVRRKVMPNTSVSEALQLCRKAALLAFRGCLTDPSQDQYREIPTHLFSSASSRELTHFARGRLDS